MVRERSLVIIKPDAVSRSLIGRIITRFEQKGLKVIGMKMEHLKEEKLKCHYEHHKDKEFFGELIEFMGSVPSVLVVLEGKEAVEVVRKMCGTTCGRDAEAGTIRGDFSVSMQQNVIHASENKEAAKKEIDSFFGKEELTDYRKIDFDYLYCKSEKKGHK
jgi:nucleoside-diphosphate kinase